MGMHHTCTHHAIEITIIVLSDHAIGLLSKYFQWYWSHNGVWFKDLPEEPCIAIMFLASLACFANYCTMLV